MTHKVVNPETAHVIPESNPAITEQLTVDQALRSEANQELEEFENAFEIVHREEEEG